MSEVMREDPQILRQLRTALVGVYMLPSGRPAPLEFKRVKAAGQLVIAVYPRIKVAKEDFVFIRAQFKATFPDHFVSIQVVTQDWFSLQVTHNSVLRKEGQRPHREDDFFRVVLHFAPEAEQPLSRSEKDLTIWDLLNGADVLG